MELIYVTTAIIAFVLMVLSERRFAKAAGLTVRKRTLALYAVLSLVPLVNAVLALFMFFDVAERETPFFDDGIYPRND